ncbi:DUF2237 family protein [Pseudaestuariivita rosea]|uniref:DUF2237 family protein n=1 Tax=Pseudaestuariivita rosea TaxID=2763263 RepID=UPI001ABB84A6|nr:DUF2237 domain-containing protein [Pseudaestuariivita rosea]
MSITVNLTAKNVLGTALQTCSLDPVTGYFRDGCCNTGPTDTGTHVVCAQMTDDFLAFSRAQGNDLSTPRPEYGFSGLKQGDWWCLCVSRWKEAEAAGKAPKINLQATHAETLQYVTLSKLKEYAV